MHQPRELVARWHGAGGIVGVEECWAAAFIVMALHTDAMVIFLNYY